MKQVTAFIAIPDDLDVPQKGIVLTSGRVSVLIVPEHCLCACGGLAITKGVCLKCYLRRYYKKRRALIPPHQNRSGIPSSMCCGAKVRKGKPHPEGNRYCTKCRLPCQWWANKKLSIEWHCKKSGCKSIIPGRMGFCFEHYRQKYKKKPKKPGVDANAPCDDEESAAEFGM